MLLLNETTCSMLKYFLYSGRSNRLSSMRMNPYKTTWRNYKRTPYPFYEYWVKQAKWDSRARAALPLAMGAVSKVG